MLCFHPDRIERGQDTTEKKRRINGTNPNLHRSIDGLVGVDANNTFNLSVPSLSKHLVKTSIHYLIRVFQFISQNLDSLERVKKRN